MGEANKPAILAGIPTFTTARMQAAKILSGGSVHDPANLVDGAVVSAMKNAGAELIIMRLYFPSGGIPTAQEVVHSVHDSAVAFYNAGGRYIEELNEPNLQAEWDGTPEQYATHLREVIQLLRPEMPDAVWIYPGLSPGAVGSGPGWVRKYSDSEFDARCWPLVKDLFQRKGLHCYFTSEAGAIEEAARAYSHQRAFGMPIIITEASNPSPAVSKDDKARQYITFMDAAAMLEAVFFFAEQLPGFDAENWRGSAIPGIIGARVV